MLELLNARQAYLALSTGIILFLVAALTTFKVYNGSKSRFAYTLLMFTFGFALSKIIIFILNVYYDEVTIQTSNGGFYTFKLFKPYTVDVYNLFASLLFIQIWVFATKYFESYINSSPVQPCISNRGLKYLKWSVISLYAVAETILCIWMVVTRPPYLVDGSIRTYIMWLSTTRKYTRFVKDLIWLLLLTAATVITFFALHKIKKVLNGLDNGFDMCSLIVNSFMLAL